MYNFNFSALPSYIQDCIHYPNTYKFDTLSDTLSDTLNDHFNSFSYDFENTFKNTFIGNSSDIEKTYISLPHFFLLGVLISCILCTCYKKRTIKPKIVYVEAEKDIDNKEETFPAKIIQV